jgi:hypothetical protein
LSMDLLSGGNIMRNLTKAVALSAILGGAILATTPAQAWWGWPGGSNWNDDWMDGLGWGDMNFSTSMGGRGYGRGYGRDYYGYGPYGYGYPYGGYGYPYGGGWGHPYGGGWGHPYGGGWGYPYGGGWGAPGYGPRCGAPSGQPAPQDRPSSETDNN